MSGQVDPGTPVLGRTFVNGTVSWLGFRSLFGRRRGVLLFVLPAVLIALAVVVRALVGSDPDVVNSVLHAFGLVVVVPLVALIGTTGVITTEIDDGSVVYLLAKPVSRLTIVISKLVVAAGCVIVFASLPLLLSGLVLDIGEPRLALGYALGGLIGGLAYCALFAFASVLTRHAVVVGLIYVLIWEGLLGSLLEGIRWLSVTQWSAAITDKIADGIGISDSVGLPYAIVATIVVIVAGVWLAGSKLRGYSFTADE